MTEVTSPTRSHYEEGCLAAHALDLVGDRWTILILRELMLGPKRFNALRAGMPGLSANILTRRLEEMAARGLLEAQMLPSPARVKIYALTAPGRAFRPVIDALCRWGAQAPGHDPSKFISPTGLMLSLPNMISRAQAARRNDLVGFDCGAERFLARIGPHGFSAEPAAPEAPLVFRGSGNALAGVFYGPWPVAEAASRMGAEVAGDPAQAQAVVDLFRLPAKS